MDALAFRLANALVGNDSKAAGLQITLQGAPCVTLHHLAPACSGGWPVVDEQAFGALKPPEWQLWDQDTLFGTQQGAVCSQL